MQTMLDVLTASHVGKHVAAVCHVSAGQLEVGMVLHVQNKQGAWKVTSLGWPTLGQVRGQNAKQGVALLPLDQAADLQDGDVLVSDTLH